jgi:phosphosulfolactate phosphohydrolase-like enzyme
VAIVAAASHGEFREEDRVCCALIAGELLDAGYTAEDGPTAALVRRWRTASPDAWLVSKSVHYLRASGQLEDLDFILAHQDDLPDVFQLHHGEVITVPCGVALPA